MQLNPPNGEINLSYALRAAPSGQAANADPLPASRGPTLAGKLPPGKENTMKGRQSPN